MAAVLTLHPSLTSSLPFTHSLAAAAHVLSYTGGLTCNSYRLTLQTAQVTAGSKAGASSSADAKVPATLVIKLTNPEFRGRFTSVLCNLSRETRFYTHFAPLVQADMRTGALTCALLLMSSIVSFATSDMFAVFVFCFRWLN